jgi:hypothetical protein
MKFHTILFFVFFIHCFLIFHLDAFHKQNKLNSNFKNIKPMKVVFKKITLEKKKIIKRRKKGIVLRDLSYSFKQSSIENSRYTKGDLSQFSVMNEVFSKLENNVEYPSFLKELKRTGIVKATIYFNKNGKYLETNTAFSGPSFLKVNIAKALRNSFKTNLLSISKNSKGLYFDCYFDFRLITNKYEAKKSELLSDYLYFYRSGYGGERGVDYINKSLTSTLNIFSLLTLIPDTKNQKQALMRKVEEYKRDSAW